MVLNNGTSLPADICVVGIGKFKILNQFFFPFISNPAKVYKKNKCKMIKIL